MKNTISENIHADMVSPVCALEEFIVMSENPSPMLDVIALAFRKVLDDIELGKYEEKKND